MKKIIILLIIYCSYFNEIFAQKTIYKDSLKNNYGISFEVESGFHAGFIQLGFDYNYRINNRIGIGCASSFGSTTSEISSHRYKIMPYFKFDLLKNRISPFIDFGTGYEVILWRTRSLNYPIIDQINKHTLKDFFISSRVGFYVINKRRYNLSLLLEYQKLFAEGGFIGIGIICNMKK